MNILQEDMVEIVDEIYTYINMLENRINLLLDENEELIKYNQSLIAAIKAHKDHTTLMQEVERNNEEA